MIKRIRDVQPPHKGSISVAQARRAFRQVRGDAPKPGLFDRSELEAMASGRLVLVDNSTSTAAEKATSNRKRSRTRRR